MSKDRQQRRDQQASVTSGQPARDVTQAGPAPTVSDEVRPCERPECENLGHQSVRQGVWLCEVHRGISEPATRTPAEIIEHAERLLDGGPGSLQQLIEPTKPPANIPKAVHHLRRAANALPGDALRALLEDRITHVLLMDGSRADAGDMIIMGNIACALEMDAHGGAQAAKDVRAAIEALS